MCSIPYSEKYKKRNWVPLRHLSLQMKKRREFSYKNWKLMIHILSISTFNQLEAALDRHCRANF